MPGRDEDQRYARGLLEAQGIGKGNDTSAWSGDEFSVATILRIAQDAELAAHILLPAHALRAAAAERHWRKQHALSGFEIADVLADLRDLACHIAAVDVRQ